MQNTYEIAEKVLDYWFTVEFLTQDKYPSLTFDMKKVISEAKSRNSKRKTVSQFLTYDSRGLNSLYDDILSEAKSCGMTCWSNLTFYIGKIKRESCIQEIANILCLDLDRPEKNQDDITCVAFQLSSDGRYMEQTLSISTIMWALNRIKENTNISDVIRIKDYSEELESLEESLFGSDSVFFQGDDYTTEEEKKVNASPFSDVAVSIETLRKIASTIYEKYLKNHISDIDREESYQEVFSVSFDMYMDNATKEKADDDNYLGLCRDFFSADIKLLIDEVKGKSLDSTAMGTSLLEYINEPITKRHSNSKKVDLVHPHVQEDFEKQIYNILNIGNAPLGKWPSKYSPAFMQQAAINLQTGRNRHQYEGAGSIFSVNGPPGTGKTTLLKEIIVSNIIERAKLLAEYDNPDDAFVSHAFKKGDKEGNSYSQYIHRWYSLKNDSINDYSILVTSCNNTAVENISKELPRGEDLFKGLQASEKDSDAYRGMLQELSDLFDVEKTGIEETSKEGQFKDIYFTQHARKLLSDETAWGLIASALGKKSNISGYYNAVISPLIFTDFYYKKNNALNRVEQYLVSRDRFLAQLKEVNDIGKVLEKLCDLAKETCELKCKFKNTQLENSKAIISMKEHVESEESTVSALLEKMKEAANVLNAVMEERNAAEAEYKTVSSKYESVNDSIKELHRKVSEQRTSVSVVTKLFNKKKYAAVMQVADDYADDADKQKKVLAEVENSLVARKQYYDQIEGRLSDARKEYQSIENEKQTVTDQINELKEKIGKLKLGIEVTKSDYELKKKELDWLVQTVSEKGELDKPNVIDDAFIERLISDDVSESTNAQVYNPWTSKNYDAARIKLFNYALRMNKDFVLSTNKCRDNFKTLAQYWGLMYGDDKERIKFNRDDKEDFVGSLYQSLFLLTPVISSTFASIGRLFRDVKDPGVIGTLIVDEAGQAQPQMALGALFRSRKAMIVGDPKQVEPVVTDDLALLKKMFNDEDIKPYSSNKSVSVQGFADSVNSFGTYLENPGQDEDTWVGCPLVVHRRCISPMYDISNEISYNGIMKQQTLKPKADDAATFVFDKSQWINVKGKEEGKQRHYVEEQGEMICEMLDRAFKNAEFPSLYIISPFTTVVWGIRNKLKKYYKGKPEAPEKLLDWLDNNIGTVHKFQGKEANEVVFLLGCDTGNEAERAILWVNTNIVNVAVTRAKYRLCIIGDIDAWKKSSCVSEAKRIMDIFALKEIDAISKSDISPEEKEKALSEVSKSLQSVTSFSVKQNELADGEIDYSVDTSLWIKGLNREFLKYDMSVEQLRLFGFESESQIDQFPVNVRDNVKIGIKLYSLLSPIYKIKKDLDASCCAILFCKAIELYTKDVLIDVFKRIIPDCPMKGTGKGRGHITISEARKDEFTLGAFTTIINQKKKTLSEATDDIYDTYWWNSFESKMRDCKDRRNKCCHSGIFNWAAQEWLRFDMFMNDEKSKQVDRTPKIDGLLFELKELETNLKQIEI